MPYCQYDHQTIRMGRYMRFPTIPVFVSPGNQDQYVSVHLCYSSHYVNAYDAAGTAQ